MQISQLLNEISTPTGAIFIRFKEKVGAVSANPQRGERSEATYLTAYAGFANAPEDLQQGNALRNFNSINSAEDIVSMIKAIFTDKVFLSVKSLTIYDDFTKPLQGDNSPIYKRHPFLLKFMKWVEREGGDQIKIADKVGKEGPPKIKRPRKENPNFGRKIRDVEQGETKKTVTFTVGPRFYKQAQRDLPNLMRFRGPNGTFVMPNDLFMQFRAQAEKTYPYAEIKLINRVATGESLNEGSDKGPHDCGAVDGYYGRSPNPHKIEMGKRVKLTDPREIAAYMAGYKDDSTGSKVYEDSVTESMNEVAKWRKHPSARSENPHWDPPDERDDPDHYTPKYTSKGDTPPRQGSLSSRSPLRKSDISQSGPRKGLPVKSHQNRLKNQIKSNLVSNESMNEVGDTKRGQKLINKVHKRASDRLGKAVADKDPKNAKKYQDVGQQAWDRMPSDKYDEDYSKNLDKKLERLNPNLMSRYKNKNKDRQQVEADDPMVKNLPPINLTGGSQERTNSLAAMATSQPATPAPTTRADKQAATNFETQANRRGPRRDQVNDEGIGSVLLPLAGAALGGMYGTDLGTAGLDSYVDATNPDVDLAGVASMKPSAAAKGGMVLGIDDPNVKKYAGAFNNIQKYGAPVGAALGAGAGMALAPGDDKPRRRQAYAETKLVDMEDDEYWLMERGKASRAFCKSNARKRGNMGASQLSSCISQGYLSHKSGKSVKVANRRVKLDGVKMKGEKYGGPRSTKAGE